MKLPPLTKLEKNVCEYTWGCIPSDVMWVRVSKLFQEKLNEWIVYEKMLPIVTLWKINTK